MVSLISLFSFKWMQHSSLTVSTVGLHCCMGLNICPFQPQKWLCSSGGCFLSIQGSSGAWRSFSIRHYILSTSAGPSCFAYAPYIARADLALPAAAQKGQAELQPSNTKHFDPSLLKRRGRSVVSSRLCLDMLMEDAGGADLHRANLHGNTSPHVRNGRDAGAEHSHPDFSV